MSAPGAAIPQADENLPPDAPQDAVIGQKAGSPQAGRNPKHVAPPVTVNVFTRALQNTLGLSNTQMRVLSEDGYGTTYTILYWKFTDIRDWCQLKAKLPVSCGGLYSGDRKIKCLQSLACWMTDLTL